jgi:type IV pilus assembly protein PilA
MRYPLNIFRASVMTKLIIVAVLFVWLPWKMSYVYDSYKIRRKVTEGLKLATLAKAVVEENATKGTALNKGWVLPPSSNGVLVSIAQNTGVITVAYGANVDAGGWTLTVVPVLSQNPGGYAFSGNVNSSTSLIPASQVSWVCASADTISLNPTVLENKGTLPTKFAPLECRLEVARQN